MIIENKAAKTLDFGNPQNLHPSKIYMHTGIYHMLQMIYRIMIILRELVWYFTLLWIGVLLVIKQSTTYATEFVKMGSYKYKYDWKIDQFITFCILRNIDNWMHCCSMPL